MEIYIPRDLVAQCEPIAETECVSIENVIEVLLKQALERYRSDTFALEVMRLRSVKLKADPCGLTRSKLRACRVELAQRLIGHIKNGRV